jgi:hypothetical protein
MEPQNKNMPGWGRRKEKLEKVLAWAKAVRLVLLKQMLAVMMLEHPFSQGI